jgi:hypothetical protein
MKFIKNSSIALVSVSLICLGACSNNDSATKTESAPASSTPASQPEKVVKGDEKHNEGEAHKHAGGKDGHSGQVVQVGKYHIEFKPDPDKDTIHLDTVIHGDKDAKIVDAKLVAQVQLPDGSNKTLPVPYSTEENQYTAKLPVGGAGDYKVVMQVDVKGDKFNSRFSFKK